MLAPSNSHNQYNDSDYESEQFVQSTLDALSAHVAILDDSGKIIGVNTAWRQFADENGFSEKNYGIGSNYLKICDEATLRRSNDAPFIASGIRDIMGGRLNEFEMEYPCHSPIERRWFVVRVSRFDWYNYPRYIIAHQNVSELKQVEIELSHSKRRIEAILNNVNNGIVTIDSNGIIETSNRAATRIFGYGNDELVGVHLSKLITEPFDGKATFHRLNSEYGHEIIGLRKDGSEFPMYFCLNELRFDDGNLYTCIIQDITYRKRMETEILERERMQVALEKERELRGLKNRFLSMMGHELNTPLASISLSYDMLKKYSHVSTEEENEQALDNIQQQVGHLRDMVKDVMTLSRSESEGLDIDTENVDMITYCRDVVEEFYFNYHRTHNIEFVCDERDIRAQIDRRMLRRVFTNLLSNAIKYSPKGGKVSFCLASDTVTDTVTIHVIDRGIGIPKEDHARLFEPFHRAANVDNLPGTGLGLAIVKQTVELHGGSISFTSNHKGTNFKVVLPRHQY